MCHSHRRHRREGSAAECWGGSGSTLTASGNRLMVPISASRWYRSCMAMNLRLAPDAEQAVRREAERTGRSQQEVIREAVGRHLGLAGAGSGGELGMLVSTGVVRPPRMPYRKARKRLTLPPGVASTDLLSRGDRI